MEESNKKITVRDVLIHTGLATSNQDIQRAQEAGEINLTDDKGRTQFAVSQLDDASWATRVQVGQEQQTFDPAEVGRTREQNKSLNLRASRESAITPPSLEGQGRRHVDGLHRDKLTEFRGGLQRRSRKDVRLLMQNDKIQGEVIATVELAVKFRADTPHGVRELKEARQYALIQHEDNSYTIAPATPSLKRAEHHKVSIDASSDPILVDNLTIRAIAKDAIFQAHLDKELPRFKTPGKGGITR